MPWLAYLHKVFHILEVFLGSRDGIPIALFGEQTEEGGRDLVHYTTLPFCLDPRELKKHLTKEEDIMYNFMVIK